MTCPHAWEFARTWEGDSGVIGGTNEIEYWRCWKCGAEDHYRDPPRDDEDDEDVAP